MRTVLITYLFLIATFSFAQQKDSLYNNGLEALSTKNYSEAQEYFTQNIEISPSFEGYYNLAHAYAKQEDWIKSLWANEAALKYDPTNSKAIYNAKFSLDKISSDEEWTHPYSWTKRIILSIGATTWLILMFTSSLIVAVSFFFLISKRKRNSKVFWSKRLIIPFLIILILAVYCFNETMNHYNEMRYAYASEKEATLYLSPNGLKVDENLPEGKRLNVVQDQDEWVQVFTPDSRTFWVKKEDVWLY